MSPLLAALAGPAALAAGQSAGSAVIGGVKSFAGALADAMAADESSASGSARDADDSPAVRQRVTQRLAAALAPYLGSGDEIGLALDDGTGEVTVSGDSPAAEALRTALEDDPQLRSDLKQLIADASRASAGDGGYFDAVFGTPTLRLDLTGDEVELLAP